ncbi:hypothetical protein D9M68_818880 [compost metagenome]
MAAGIAGQGVFQVAVTLLSLADAKQQFGAALGQEWVVAVRFANLFEHLGDWRAGLEAFLAATQVQVGIDILAAAKTTGVGAQFHGFVAKDAKVGQYELRPVLVQVAEEHQAQALAEFADVQGKHLLVEARAPTREGLWLAIVLGQAFEQLGFFQ